MTITVEKAFDGFRVIVPEVPVTHEASNIEHAAELIRCELHQHFKGEPVYLCDQGKNIRVDWAS